MRIGPTVAWAIGRPANFEPHGSAALAPNRAQAAGILRIGPPHPSVIRRRNSWDGHPPLWARSRNPIAVSKSMEERSTTELHSRPPLGILTLRGPNRIDLIPCHL